MRKYTEDDILFYMMSEHWEPNFYHLVRIGSVYLFGTFIASFYHWDVLEAAIAIIGGIYLMGYSFRMMVSAIKRDDIQRTAFELADERVPVRFFNMALRMGYGPMDALLCYESHFPGDCPLCGAK